MRWWRLEGPEQRGWAAGSGCGEPLLEGPYWQEFPAVITDGFDGINFMKAGQAGEAGEGFRREVVVLCRFQVTAYYRAGSAAC